MVLRSNYPVFFIFDSPNNCHYTDTLLKLGSEAYLWHEIRRQRIADVSIFVSCRNGEPWVRTFDSVSSQFLNPQNFFKKMLSNQQEEAVVSPNACTVSELEQKQKEHFASWLVKRASKQNQRIALAVTYEAMTQLKQNQQLMELPDNCVLMLRMHMIQFLKKNSQN